MNESPLHVIHSCTSNSFSGLERYVLDLVSWQFQQGNSVELYCRENSELDVQARKQGIPVWTISQGDRPHPLFWAKEMRRWKSKSSRRVVLHMHAGGEPWYHLPFSRRFEKTILQFHLWINHAKKDPVHRLLYSFVNEIWSSSESARAHLIGLLPVSREKMRVVPYGRDVKNLAAIPRESWRREERARLGLSDQDVLAVTIARLEKIKGVSELFDAFVETARKNPKAHLLIVGDASPENSDAQIFAQGLRARHAALEESVRRRIFLPGYLDGVSKVLAAADFYVLPSYEECMSLALLDALILGLPAIGTNTGGTPSVVRPGETGMLVPAQDSTSLASALSAMFENADLRAQLSHGARALSADFEREAIFSKIWNWYTI